MTLIHRCVECGRYTLSRERCHACGGEVRSAHPPNISTQHRYLKLILESRRRAAGGGSRRRA